MQKRAILTAAITGSIHTPAMSPYLPITPKQIIDEAFASYEAGAAIAHIHVRDPRTGRPTPDINLIGEVVSIHGKPHQSAELGQPSPIRGAGCLVRLGA